MKILLIIIGFIIMIIPGGIPLLIICGIVFPRQRQILMTTIFNMKGEIAMAIESGFNKIKGVATPKDHLFVQKVDICDLDSSRVDGVDKAFKYLEEKLGEKAISWYPALMVGAFGIGAAVVAIVWILSTPTTI